MISLKFLLESIRSDESAQKVKLIVDSEIVPIVKKIGGKISKSDLVSGGMMNTLNYHLEYSLDNDKVEFVIYPTKERNGKIITLAFDIYSDLTTKDTQLFKVNSSLSRNVAKFLEQLHNGEVTSKPRPVHNYEKPGFAKTKL